MRICVYCSSSNYITENYLQTAFRLGEKIAERGDTLVFGGATGGSMSAVSKGAASKAGKIVGVIPKAVIRLGRQSKICTELYTTATMSERKAMMRVFADVFVVLPGSYGTLDEMFDVTASGVVGEHHKPIFVLNEADFYADLQKLSEKMIRERFIPLETENYKPIFVKSIEELFEEIEKL